MIVRTRMQRAFTLRASAYLLVVFLVGSGSAAGQGTPAGKVQAPPKETQAVAPTAVATKAVMSRTECERYIDVLAGRKEDRESLKKSQVRTLAAQSPELVTCGAIAADSDALCRMVSQWNQGKGGELVGNPSAKEGAAMGCHRVRFVFQELRANPKGRSFMLPFTREECATLDNLSQPCVAFVDALRAGGVEKCTGTGAFESLCRAFMTMDKSQCKPIQGLPPDLPQACTEMINKRGFLAQGLKGLADPGPPSGAGAEFGGPDEIRVLAKAALGQKDACKAYEKAAMDFCMTISPEPAAATPVSGTPIPATPAP